jgi:hypothetical protein
MGCHVGSQGKTEILAVRSQIQVQDPLATGALIDKLEYRTVQHQYLPTSSFSDRKDLNHAIAVITNWPKLEQNHQRHQFILSE